MRTKLSEHSCVFCFCAHASSHLQNGLWDSEQYIVPRHPKHRRCQCNCSSTYCNIQNENFRILVLCKSLKDLIYGLTESPFLLEVSQLFFIFYTRTRESFAFRSTKFARTRSQVYLSFLSFSKKEAIRVTAKHLCCLKCLFQPCHNFQCKKKKKRWANSHSHSPTCLVVSVELNDVSDSEETLQVSRLLRGPAPGVPAGLSHADFTGNCWILPKTKLVNVIQPQRILRSTM